MDNFIPELYADMLMVQRPEETVFAKLCTTEYNGKIEALGDRVHITGLGRPTIQTYTKEQTLTAEYMNDYTVEMVIDQAKYFDVWLDDVDKKQALADPTATIIQEARRALAESMDAYIGTLYSQAGTSVTETQLSSTNVIEKISNGIVQLYKNNVPTSEPLFLVVSPEVAEKIMIADIVFNTNNSETISNGWLGRMKKFINATVFMSNNVYSPSTVDYCMLFTKRAIGLAEQIPAGSVEKMRSETKMADLVRGLHLYGAKVIKPKELVSLNFTTVAEA